MSEATIERWARECALPDLSCAQAEFNERLACRYEWLADWLIQFERHVAHIPSKENLEGHVARLRGLATAVRRGEVP